MKTLYVTNLSSNLTDHIIGRFNKLNEKLPGAVRHQKLIQACIQILILTTEGDGYGFYEYSTEVGRPLTKNDPVGSITMRIDYDPNCDGGQEAGGNPKWEPYEIYTNAIMALRSPNMQDQFPPFPDALIDHVRVEVVVAPEVIASYTFWATQFTELLDGFDVK